MLLKKSGQPKVEHKLPPNWDKINASGMYPDPEIAVVTYGDTIYVPSGNKLPDHLMEHEKMHSVTQLEYPGGPDAWWQRYYADIYFRIQEEANAYGAQYAFSCRQVKDRNQQTKFLVQLAHELASPLYGSVIDTMSAMRMFKKVAGEL